MRRYLMSARKVPFFGKVNIGVFIGGFLLVVAFVIGILWAFSSRMPSSKVATSQATSAADLNPEPPGTISIWAWNTAAKSLQALIPEFNKRYPDITVKVLEISHDDANQKFRLAVTTGSGFPDVWDTEGPLTYEYIKAGALMDLTSLASQYKNDFVSYKWAEVMQNNKIYAIPWDTAPAGLFYRRDLFSQAGIDPTKIETWDDYIAAGKKLVQSSTRNGKPEHYMTLMSKTVDTGDTFQILLSQFGGSIFNADGKPTLDTPEGLQAIVLMKKIYDAQITTDIGWWTPQFFDAIKTGVIASLPQGAWMGGQIKDIAPKLTGKWGVILLPAVKPGGVRSAVRGGSNLAIPSKAQHKDEAWKFIEFVLTRKENQIAMYKQYQIFPALKSAYEDPIFHAADPYYANQITGPLFFQVQDSIPQNYYYGPFYDQSNKILSGEITNVLLGSKSPKQALQDAQKVILERLNPKK